MPELFQIFKSHSGIRKKRGSMDLVHLSGGLLVKILLGNWIFAPLSLMDTPLKALTLNFLLANADFDRGTVGKYWNRNTKIFKKKIMEVDFQIWITFLILLGNWIFANLRIMDTPLTVLTLNLLLGNADFDRGTLQKYWNRNTKMSTRNDKSRFSNMNNFWNPFK
jgi:hypothetical protein